MRPRIMSARASVDAARQLAVVPRRALALDEAQGDALGRLGGDHLADAVGQIAHRDAGLAREQLAPDAGDRVGVADDLDVALEHHAAQLVVALARLDLDRRPRVAFEVLDLLGGAVGPRPHLAAAHDVPERHEVRPAVAAGRGADDRALLVEEGEHLLVGHLDLFAAAHTQTALRGSLVGNARGPATLLPGSLKRGPGRASPRPPVPPRARRRAPAPRRRRPP